MEIIYVFNPIWQTVLKDLIKVELKRPGHYLVAFSFKTIIHLSRGLFIRLPKVLFFDYWIMWVLHITQLSLKLYYTIGNISYQMRKLKASIFCKNDGLIVPAIFKYLLGTSEFDIFVMIVLCRVQKSTIFIESAI